MGLTSDQQELKQQSKAKNASRACVSNARWGQCGLLTVHLTCLAQIRATEPANRHCAAQPNYRSISPYTAILKWPRRKQHEALWPNDAVCFWREPPNVKLPTACRFQKCSSKGQPFLSSAQPLLAISCKEQSWYAIRKRRILSHNYETRLKTTYCKRAGISVLLQSFQHLCDNSLSALTFDIGLVLSSPHRRQSCCCLFLIQSHTWRCVLTCNCQVLVLIRWLWSASDAPQQVQLPASYSCFAPCWVLLCIYRDPACQHTLMKKPKWCSQGFESSKRSDRSAHPRYWYHTWLVQGKIKIWTSSHAIHPYHDHRDLHMRLNVHESCLDLVDFDANSLYLCRSNLIASLKYLTGLISLHQKMLGLRVREACVSRDLLQFGFGLKGGVDLFAHEDYFWLHCISRDLSIPCHRLQTSNSSQRVLWWACKFHSGSLILNRASPLAGTWSKRIFQAALDKRQ